VTSIALAVLLGAAAFPVVLVFGPVYFPWSLLVLASLGGVVGLSVAPRGSRPFGLAVVLAVLMVAAVLGALAGTSNIVLSSAALVASLVWIGWLLLPFFVGVYTGAWLRARSGIARATAIGAATVGAIALAGAGLAFALAPAEVANAPRCDGDFDCPRTWCGYMADRRRFLTIEHVTAFDGSQITCTYTAWGGIEIGRADMSNRGGSWTDGWWPEFVSGRRR
jgi:hypothetical protein